MDNLTEFLFAEFAEGQPVEVLRVGEFLDRSGKKVKITETDIDQFVVNFDAGEAGQEVPIDISHERQEAGGWVKRLWRDDNKLLAEVDWNELGRKLVGEKVYRYLSATIDLAKKVIKSISLVNFPAIKGLRPVELSEGVYGLEADMGLLERVLTAVTAVFQKPATVNCECLECGHVLETKEHCTDIKCPECGGEMRRVERPGPGRLAEFVIRKEDDEIILYDSKGEKILGRFPFGPGKEYADEEAARKAAAKRERQIQYFKHAEGGEMAEDWAELQGNIKNIVAAWHRWAGSFDACVRELRGKPGIKDPEALCAWLHKQAEGKWPAEGGEYSPTLAELQAVAEVLVPVIAKLEIESDEGDAMTEKEVKELREQIRQEIETEMVEKEKGLTELREEVREELEVELTERFERRQKLIEFAEELCSSDAGLSAKPDDVVAFLAELDTEQVEQAKALLKSKVVDFTERGSEGAGEAQKERLPAEVAVHLREWVEAGNSLAEFLEVAELDEDEFDLSEYKEDE